MVYWAQKGRIELVLYNTDFRVHPVKINLTTDGKAECITKVDPGGWNP